MIYKYVDHKNGDPELYGKGNVGGQESSDIVHNLWHKPEMIMIMMMSSNDMIKRLFMM